MSTKTAHKAAAKHAPAKQAPATPAPATREEETAARASAATAPAEPEIASSDAAAEQRLAQPGTQASAQKADEAKPVAFAEVVTRPPGADNLEVLESRLKAKIVGESANAAAGAPGSKPGEPVVRTVQRPIPAATRVQASEDVETFEEVAVPAPNGVDEIVFTPQAGGGVEISTQNAANINSLRGGAHTTIVKLSAEAWSKVQSAASGGAAGAKAPEAQSAAEQRAGASEDGDGGPAAPAPVVL